MNPKLDQEIEHYVSENLTFNKKGRTTLSHREIVEMAYHFANWEHFSAIRNSNTTLTL